MESPSQSAADYFHTILSNALGDFLNEVKGHSDPEKYSRVSETLRTISSLYREGLSETGSEYRSDWSNPANQCAYVYLYFMHHCYMVYMAMQPLLSPRFSHIKARLEHRITRHGRLRVCSIGGGPGSDIVGLSRFLNDSDLLPPSLHFTVLDRYPQWASAWKKIRKHIRAKISVTYEGCDLVRESTLHEGVLQRIRKADIVTLQKSFSAVAAFMEEERHREILLRVFCELKLGCLVVFVDNRRRDTVTVPFYDLFALPTGLQLVNQWEGIPKIPLRGYFRQVNEFKTNVDFNPMSSCVVTNLLLVKARPGSIQELGLRGINYGIYRDSLGDYGGSYEETPAVLKNIWVAERSLHEGDSLDDLECEDYFDNCEYTACNFEGDFRDVRGKKNILSWTRAMKLNKRKRMKLEKEQCKRAKVNVNERTNQLKTERRSEIQTREPWTFIGVVARQDRRNSKRNTKTRKHEIRDKEEDRRT